MNAVEDRTAREIKCVRRVTWGGISVNLLLAGVKFLFGFIGSSQVVIADAVHSLSDMTTDIAVLFGVKFWAAPPDEDHPYGHRRIESLVALAIGLLLVGMALGMIWHSLSTLREPSSRAMGWIAIVAPLCSIVFKELLYHWSLRVGLRFKSSAVIANAWHHRSDVLSSILALVAVGTSLIYPQLAFVDNIGAIVIAIFIIKIAWEITCPALRELSDSGASLKTRERIKDLAVGVPGVKDVHAVRTRWIGSGINLDMHVLVDREISVEAGHAISEDVQRELLENGPSVLDVVVHIEPYAG